MSSIDAQIQAIMQKAKSDIESTLLNEVFEDAKNKMKETIDSNVYGVYTPKVYERRHENGGLGDNENIQIVDMDSNRGDMSIEIRNVAKGNSPDGYGNFYENGLYLDDLVEGNGTWGDVGARKFREDTTNKIDDNLKNTMSKGLKAKGWEVE